MHLKSSDTWNAFSNARLFFDQSKQHIYNLKPQIDQTYNVIGELTIPE